MAELFSVKDAGKVSIRPRGTYDKNMEYEKLDMVLYRGNSYLAVRNSVGKYPDQEDSYWQPMTNSGGADPDFDPTSTNGIQNKVVTNAINDINTSLAKAYKSDDEVGTDFANNDYVPFYDTSASKMKRSTWSNILSKIKTLFANATQSEAGLMSAADKTKLDGVATNANNYSLPLSANGTRGGMQIGFTQSGKNYPVQLSSEKAYVNVPWENTTYESKGAASEGTAVSLVTTGEKYTWNNKAPKEHASSTNAYGSGTANNFGHVKLSDVYTSNVGAAANSIGASQTALYNAYTELIKRTGTIYTNTGSFISNSSASFKRAVTITNMPAGSYIMTFQVEINKSLGDITITAQLRSGSAVLRTIRGSGKDGGGMCGVYPMTLTSSTNDINVVVFDAFNSNAPTVYGRLEATRIC